MPLISIDFDPRAIAEAQAARKWYARRIAEAWERFLAELDRAIRQIRATPGQWPSYLHGTRVYRVRLSTSDCLSGDGSHHPSHRCGTWQTQARILEATIALNHLHDSGRASLPASPAIRLGRSLALPGSRKAI